MLGTFIGFCGAAFGSVGGVGGGGIFVPMLSLIVGFDPKSATAISKCKVFFFFFSFLKISLQWHEEITIHLNKCDFRSR